MLVELDAVHMNSQAWRHAKPKTGKNSFKRAFSWSIQLKDEEDEVRKKDPRLLHNVPAVSQMEMNAEQEVGLGEGDGDKTDGDEDVGKELETRLLECLPGSTSLLLTKLMCFADKGGGDLSW